MNVRLESICHGDGKVFLQLIIDRLRDDGFLSLSVFLKDGPEVPAHLFPFRPLNEESEANFVVVLPHFDVREVELDFTEVGLGDKPLSHTRMTVELNLVKWKTRFNSIVKTDLINRMLDIEREYCADRMNIYFTDAVDEGAEVVVKMLVDMPEDTESDVHVNFLDDYGQPLELPVYPLIDEVVPAERLGDPDRLQVGFSVRVPCDRIEFTANAYDVTGSISGGFARFCQETYEPLRELFTEATMDAAQDPNYGNWYRYHCATLADLAIQRQTSLSYEPLVSLVIPLFEVDRPFAKACLHSLLMQTYSNFEVVLIDACSDEGTYDGLLEEWEEDTRLIHIVVDASTDEATCALTGLMQSEGEYRGLLSPHITLAPEALFEFIRRINEAIAPQQEEAARNFKQLQAFESNEDRLIRPGLLYANHDTVTTQGEFINPVLKPSYSPDLFCSYDYIGPFVLMDKEVILAIADQWGFIDEAFLYDLILKAIEHAGTVERVDQVLYHWQETGSLSELAQEELQSRKERDFRGGRRAVAHHLRRLDIDAVVVADDLYERYQLKYRIPKEAPKLTIVIPNKDQSNLLDTCVHSILDQTGFDNYEILIMENGSVETETLALYDRLLKEDKRIRIELYPKPFTVATLANAAFAISESDYVLLLDNDTEFIDREGLAQLVGHCMRKDVGVVGAKLLFSDDTIQHAGMTVGPFGGAGNLCVNLPATFAGYMKRLVCSNNVAAVSSSCVMIDRAVFNEVGGFDERFHVGYYDVDFCLKVQAAGYHVAYNADVNLYHYENATQGHLLNREQRLRLEQERAYLHYKWPNWFVDGDPYMSACLDSDSIYFQLSTD